MAKRRTEFFDVSATMKGNDLQVLVVKRDTGRIMAALVIPGDAAQAFSETVAETLKEAAKKPQAETPPPKSTATKKKSAAKTAKK